MVCVKCGASNPDGSSFCYQCGSALDVPRQNAPAAPYQTPPPQNIPQPPYYAPYPSYPAAGQAQYGPKTSGLAIASAILGVLSCMCCCTVATGPAAIVLGHVARSSIRKSNGWLKGGEFAIAGLAFGYLSLVIILVSFIANFVPSFSKLSVSGDENTAVEELKSIHTAQEAYAKQYPVKGYAGDLATLGAGPGKSCDDHGTETYACLLNDLVTKPECTGSHWCRQHGFKFNLQPAEKLSGGNTEYVVTAMPDFGNSSTKNFCIMSDGVVHAEAFALRITPYTAEECAKQKSL